MQPSYATTVGVEPNGRIGNSTGHLLSHLAPKGLHLRGWGRTYERREVTVLMMLPLFRRWRNQQRVAAAIHEAHDSIRISIRKILVIGFRIGGPRQQTGSVDQHKLERIVPGTCTAARSFPAKGLVGRILNQRAKEVAKRLCGLPEFDYLAKAKRLTVSEESKFRQITFFKLLIRCRELLREITHDG